MDFYGFGDTPHLNKELFLDDYVSSVIEIIDYYKMSNVILVGHSFGGRVAIKIAAKHGYLLEKIVLVDSAGILPRRGLKYYFKIYFHKLCKKIGIKHLGGSKDYRALPIIMKQTFKNIVNEDLLPLIKKITLPTLLIWGDKDKETPIYMAKLMHKNIIGSGLIIFRGSGHFAYIQRSDIFYAILNNFCAGGKDGISDNNYDCDKRHNIVIKIPRVKSE